MGTKAFDTYGDIQGLFNKEKPCIIDVVKRGAVHV